jgi:hypothetical protein
MEEKPILMSTPMVQALLNKDNPKTQTRRVMKPQPDNRGYCNLKGLFVPIEKMRKYCPYGQVGDKLWVRETWLPFEAQGPNAFLYKADIALINLHYLKWRPSIFMPRKASRITLEITDIRVQRLQEITEKDAIAEGIPAFAPNGIIRNYKIPQMQYEVLWDKLNGKKYSWADNPFVWIISFKRV